MGCASSNSAAVWASTSDVSTAGNDVRRRSDQAYYNGGASAVNNNAVKPGQPENYGHTTQPVHANDGGYYDNNTNTTTTALNNSNSRPGSWSSVLSRRSSKGQRDIETTQPHVKSPGDNDDPTPAGTEVSNNDPSSPVAQQDSSNPQPEDTKEQQQQEDENYPTSSADANKPDENGLRDYSNEETATNTTNGQCTADPETADAAEEEREGRSEEVKERDESESPNNATEQQQQQQQQQGEGEPPAQDENDPLDEGQKEAEVLTGEGKSEDQTQGQQGEAEGQTEGRQGEAEGHTQTAGQQDEEAEGHKQTEGQQDEEAGGQTEGQVEGQQEVIAEEGEGQTPPPLAPPVKTQAELVPDLTVFAELDEFSKETPEGAASSVDSLVAHLTTRCSSDLDIVRALFCWVACNIQYDTAAYQSHGATKQPQDVDAVLQSGQAMCKGYSQLFQALCQSAKIPCVHVEGLAKGFSHDPEDVFTPDTKNNHSWNLVLVLGEWRPLDVTWGAGHVDKDGSFTRKFKDVWFLTDPEVFVLRHFPVVNADPEEGQRQQLLATPLSLEEFSASVRPESLASEIGLRCLTHPHTVVEVAGDVTIKVKATRHQLQTVSVSLTERGQEEGEQMKDRTNTVTSFDADGTCSIYVRAPRAATFLLDVMGQLPGQDMSTLLLLVSYVISEPEPFPRAFKPAYRQRARLLTPRCAHVPAGGATLFRLTAPALTQVSVGDTSMVLGDDGVWEAEVTPEEGADDITLFATSNEEAMCLTGFFKFSVTPANSDVTKVSESTEDDTKVPGSTEDVTEASDDSPDDVTKVSGSTDDVTQVADSADDVPKVSDAAEEVTQEDETAGSDIKVDHSIRDVNVEVDQSVDDATQPNTEAEAVVANIDEPASDVPRVNNEADDVTTVSEPEGDVTKVNAEGGDVIKVNAEVDDTTTVKDDADEVVKVNDEADDTTLVRDEPDDVTKVNGEADDVTKVTDEADDATMSKEGADDVTAVKKEANDITAVSNEAGDAATVNN